MDFKISSLVFLALLLTICHGLKRHRMVVYWGQSSIYNLNSSPSVAEKPLKHFCEKSSYNTIVLAFLHVFFNPLNKDKMPTLNFAHHCYTSVRSDMPSLLKCPDIAKAIKICQKNGIKVLMSLGGAVGPYGFTSDAQARTFAHTIWDLLLAGTNLPAIRPFGDAILDGVDLDIEVGPTTGYIAFVKELRQLMGTDTTRHYTIAAAPQCVYPDKYMGPRPGTPLGDIPQLIDEIYIQFYNNYCQTGDRYQFDKNFETWLSYSEKNNGPIIYIGMPSHDRAAYLRGHWRTPAEVASIYKKYKNETLFGGFMLWDASFDEYNSINGKPYSESIVKLFDEVMVPSVSTTTTTPTTTTTATTIKVSTPAPKTGSTTAPTKGSTSAPTKGSTTAPTNVPTTTPTKKSRGIVSCKGLPDGTYAHAKDCAEYVQCHAGRTFIYKCSPNTKFSEKLRYCDWAVNVDC